MRCPVCKTELVITGSERLQTLSEHVCDPNSEPCLKSVYQCPKEGCSAHDFGAVWNSDGEYYTYNMGYENSIKFENNCIGKNPGPFGTLERQMNVEIQKMGLKNKKYLHPCLTLWFLKPYIEYTYRSNFDGEILKKGFQIKFLKRDKKHFGGRYCVVYISGIHMFRFVWKHFYRDKKNFKEKQSRFSARQIIGVFEDKKDDKRWWAVAFRKYLNIFEKKVYNQAKIVEQENPPPKRTRKV